MTKLSDTQLVVLGAAAQRADLSVLPLPDSLKLKGGAARQGDGRPPQPRPDPGHRDRRRAPAGGHHQRGHGRDVGRRDRTATTRAEPARTGRRPTQPRRRPRATAPAVEAPAPTTEADGAATPAKTKPAKRKGKAKAAKAAPAASEPEAATGATPTAKPTPRAGTKQALMIDMLKRPEGATVEQIAAATGWQHHTIRGAISGALKKKLGLTVEATRTREVGPNKTGAKGSSTVYRIVA